MAPNKKKRRIKQQKRRRKAFKRRMQNSPCWCGSGKQYKYCHLGRENEPSPKISDVTNMLNKNFSKKMCLCPEEWKNDCEGGIVKAHTISRGMLEKIGVEGHVYGLNKNFGALVSDKGQIRLKKMGINKASVFTGFCGKHDFEIFKPIENESFEINNKNAFLLAYRAFCYEHFTKKAALEMIPFMSQLDKGRSVPEQAYLQKMVESMKIGFKTAIRDQKLRKEQYDRILMNEEFEEIKYYIVELDKLPVLMCSGGIYPTFDFQGNRLQNLADLEIELESIFLSVIADDENKGLVAFAWIGDNNGPCDKFIKSYHQLTECQKTQAIIRFVFEYSENKYINIDWWESLTEKVRDTLYKRQEKAFNPVKKRQSDCLTDDGIHYVDYKLINIHTNIELE